MDRTLYYKIILVVATGTVILFALVTVTGLSKDSAPQDNLQAGFAANTQPSVIKLAHSPPSSPAVGFPVTHTQLPSPQPSRPPAASPALQAPEGAAQPQHALPVLQLKAGWKWEQYHSYDELMEFMLWMAAAANHSCRTYSIGKSVQGREMRVVELGGTSGAQSRRQLQGEAAFKPVVKLLAGQHGDETASMELLLHFAWYLAASHGRDPRVTALLSATSVHILPVINPDGLVAHTRNNANNADLNRNFPLTKFPYAKPGPEGVGDSAAVQHWREAGDKPVQPENAAIMAWAQSNPSVLSANAHGGALVANYPFDACDTEGLQSKCPTPEDPLPQFLAQVYASNHPEMRANNRDGFTNGTTSGARWYPVIGSMQDWLYHNSRTLDLTFELHDHKMPSLAYLASMWPHNLPSLMRYCEMAHVGVLGRVVDAADTSKALEAGVEVLQPAGGRAVATNPAWGGAFFKLLAPNRSYCLGVAPKGYERVLLAVRVPQDAGGVIRAKGLEGLTVEVQVEAWPAGSGAARKVVVVGGASPDVCKEV